MKYLFYNPMEQPSKIKVKSSVFGIDTIYEEPYSGLEFCVYMDELFKMAECQCFDDVAVYFTEHNEAFAKRSLKSFERISITGWISLKKIKNGGGYLMDGFLV